MSKIDHEKLNRNKSTKPPDPWFSKGKGVKTHLKGPIGGTKCGHPCSIWKAFEDIEKVTCRICSWLHRNPGKTTEDYLAQLKEYKKRNKPKKRKKSKAWKNKVKRGKK